MPNVDLPDPLERDPRGEFDGRYDVTDKEYWSGAVLLADEIRHYCEDPNSPMISPFDPEKLRAASYSLRLGEEIHVGGSVAEFRDGKVVLEPHQVAVVSTLETLNIPRFLIARWSLRVMNIYQGLLWTGGPQVDPGWRGRLFCPVYNLSNQDVVLRSGESFFTIDFSKTTALTDDYYSVVEDNPKARFRTLENPSLDDFDKRLIHSSFYEKLKDVDEVKDEVRQFRATILTSLGLVFAAIAALVGGLALFTASTETGTNPGIDNPWVGFAVAASVAAFILALASCGLMLRVSGIARLQTVGNEAATIHDRAWGILTLPPAIAFRLVMWPFVRILKFISRRRDRGE